MSRSGLPLSALVLAVLLAACGSSASASPSPGASTQPAASASPAASQDAGASASAAASAPASAAPSSGGAASAACDLVSAEEAAGILGVASTTTEAIPGDISYCTYTAPDVGSVLATSYATAGGKDVYAVYKAEEGATLVPGLGDAAVFSPSTNTLFVLKGDKMVGITAGAAGTEAADRLELSKKVAAIAAGRM